MGLPARKLVPEAERRIEEVSLSLDGERLIFIFANGEGCSLVRKDLPGDDGTPVTAVQIFDHRGAVAISQASGHSYDLPWDSIKHYSRGGRPARFRMGAVLKRLRRERRLSQEALARASGISRMQLARLERDLSTPNLDTLLRLARTLGLAPRDLIR